MIGHYCIFATGSSVLLGLHKIRDNSRSSTRFRNLLLSTVILFVSQYVERVTKSKIVNNCCKEITLFKKLFLLFYLLMEFLIDIYCSISYWSSFNYNAL